LKYLAKERPLSHTFNIILPLFTCQYLKDIATESKHIEVIRGKRLTSKIIACIYKYEVERSADYSNFAKDSNEI